jgi:hypothetical protein
LSFDFDVKKTDKASPFPNRTMLRFEPRFEVEKAPAFSAFHWSRLEELAIPANREPANDLELSRLDSLPCRRRYHNAPESHSDA